MSSTHATPITTERTQICGKCSKAAADLKKCAKCKSILYCNRECQTAHWKAHKRECSRMAGESSRGTRSSGDSANGSSQGPAKPFTAISNGTYLHGWSEKQTYEVLVDIVRMRQEDTYTLMGDTMMGTIYDGESSSEKAFRDMLRRAQRVPGLLPSWWNDEKEKECIQLSREALRYAQEKSDIQETWKDDRMPMKLRMLGERIYGNTPGVQGSGPGQNMLDLMVAMEGGGTGAASHFDLGGAFGRR